MDFVRTIVAVDNNQNYRAARQSALSVFAHRSVLGAKIFYALFRHLSFFGLLLLPSLFKWRRSKYRTLPQMLHLIFSLHALAMWSSEKQRKHSLSSKDHSSLSPKVKLAKALHSVVKYATFLFRSSCVLICWDPFIGGSHRGLWDSSDVQSSFGERFPFALLSIAVMGLTIRRGNSCGHIRVISFPRLALDHL